MRLLLLGLLTTGIGQSLVFTILPPLGREIGFSELQVNAIIATSAVLFAGLSPVWGRFSDRIGRKPVILIGLTGYTIGNLVFTGALALGLFGWLAGLPLFLAALLARCSQSLVISATTPASMSYAADRCSRQKRTGTLAKLGTATSMGMILGPIMGGVMAGLGLLTPMIAASVLAGAAALLIAYRLPPIPLEAEENRPPRAKVKLTDPRLRPIVVAAIGGFTGFAGIQQTLAFRLQDTLGLDAPTTVKYAGFCMMVSALTTLLMQMTVAQRFTGSPLTLLRVGLACFTIGGVIVMLDIHFALTLVAMSFVGAGVGLTGPSVVGAASLAVEKHEQGGAAGVAVAGPATGFVLGPIGGAALYEVSPTASGLGIVCTLVAVLLYLLLSPKARQLGLQTKP
jgi:MFS family permease